MAFEIVHPAVVHFPIALLMTAAPVAILGAITRKPTWQRVATVCLVLGAAGSFMAVETGEEMEEADYVASKALIHEHEEMAEKTMVAAIALALLAVGVEVVTARSMGPKMLGTGGRWAVAAGAVAVAGMVEKVVVVEQFERRCGEDAEAGMAAHGVDAFAVHLQFVPLRVVAGDQADGARADAGEFVEQRAPHRADGGGGNGERVRVREGGHRQPGAWEEDGAGGGGEAFAEGFGDDAIETERQVGAVPFQRAPGADERRVCRERDGEFFGAQFGVAADHFCV